MRGFAPVKPVTPIRIGMATRIVFSRLGRPEISSPVTHELERQRGGLCSGARVR
jgi:hypothetical protein